jgi:citrate lyase beta subunit
MEDGVALNQKERARQVIVEALQTLNFGRSERLVRINAIGSGLEEKDIETALPAHPDGIVLPKVDSSAPIRWASAKIAAAESEFGWSSGKIGLIAIVETALGILNLAQIASADPRLQALVFGAEDFASDIGAIRTAESWEVFYARSALVTAASAFGLQAIDMVKIDFKDLQALQRESLQGAKMGFSGKQIIHPNQIVPVQEAFTPDDAAIEQALRITTAFNEHQSVGKGAFALDGKMIDAPIVKAAERILERARAAGKV